MSARDTAPFDGPATGDLIRDEVRHVIETAIVRQPRSQQRMIGPSELGNPCDHCLAARLAGWERNEDTAWLPWIGTAVHASIANAFLDFNAAVDSWRYSIEERVTVGNIADTPIAGSCDLFDHSTGTVIDHKIVGKTTLDTARRSGPSETYRIQAHLYGRGWENAGHTVTAVAINYLPRNAVSMAHGVWWSEPYDPQVATDALTRATGLHNNMTALTSVSVQARDAWITGLDRNPDCRDCARYPDRPTTPSPLTELLG